MSEIPRTLTEEESARLTDVWQVVRDITSEEEPYKGNAVELFSAEDSDAVRQAEDRLRYLEAHAERVCEWRWADRDRLHAENETQAERIKALEALASDRNRLDDETVNLRHELAALTATVERVKVVQRGIKLALLALRQLTGDHFALSAQNLGQIEAELDAALRGDGTQETKA